MTHEFTDPREKAQYLPTLDPDIKEGSCPAKI